MAEHVYLAVLLACALYLFWTQKLRTDVTAACVLLALAVPWPRPDGTLEPILTLTEAYSGFGSPAVVMIAAMFVIAGAVVQTGVAESLGLRLLRRVAHSEWRLQASILALATGVSMFINDTTVVVILLPVILGLCREYGLSPSRYLMFAAYGSLLGGQWTLIGTRSNLILSDLLRQRTGSGLGFFDMTPVAAGVFVLAAVFLLMAGRRLLPRAEPPFSARGTRQFLTEVVVPEGSSVIGQPPSAVDPFRGHTVTMVALLRAGKRMAPWTALQAGDVIVVRGPQHVIGSLIKSPAFKVREEVEMDQALLESADLVTVEAVVPARSDYRGLSVSASAFDHDYGVTLVGVAHHGQSSGERMVQRRLQAGDSLLFLGTREEVERLRQNANLLLVEEQSFPAIGNRRALIMLGLLAAMVFGAVSGIVTPALTIPLVALASVLFGCIGLRSAYQSVDWPTVVTLAGMIPFGLAMEKTGAAQALAGFMVNVFTGVDPLVLLGAVLLVAVLLTQIIENAAVAIVLAPVMLRVAEDTGMDAKSVMVALAVCVSAGFSTPVAHESTMLVMNAGSYRFKHYLLLGGALAVITWLTASLLTPLIWPLQ